MLYNAALGNGATAYGALNVRCKNIMFLPLLESSHLFVWVLTKGLVACDVKHSCFLNTRYKLVKTIVSAVAVVAGNP